MLDLFMVIRPLSRDSVFYGRSKQMICCRKFLVVFLVVNDVVSFFSQKQSGGK